MRQSERGFTIIELIVVIVVLGLLATMALPRLRYTKERAYRASMMSDLKNLVALQEGYFSAANDYAGGLTSGPEKVAKGASGRISFTPSPGNTIAVTRRNPAGARGPGWTATVRNPQVTTKSADICGIYIGHKAYAPNAKVASAGIPACY
ncbi:MAG TPA: prepilin-type N-terminal cleavage/methylation domain-containing protein [Gemmatimonadales bacterium]|jgi:prepilin-type N-terminal cleavage/methylation domain-containing protein|nr:prepilin-type N-terminal cleavage/methylation domain-containing protein [Gemmatimonadales bacterium]